MEWRHSGSPCPKNFRVQKSAGKFLASIFWDQDGILLIDYLPKGQTINAKCYLSLLVQLKDILKEKRRVKFTVAAETWFDGQPSEFFEWLENLEQRALALHSKFCKLRVDYV